MATASRSLAILHVVLREQDLEGRLGRTDLPAHRLAELSQVELPGEEQLDTVVVDPLGQEPIGSPGVLDGSLAVGLHRLETEGPQLLVEVAGVVGVRRR